MSFREAAGLHDGIRLSEAGFVGDAPQFDDLTLVVVGRQE